MVAKITTPHKIIAALNYNENKVKQDKAECLYAGNFLKDAQQMSFYQKQKGFDRLNELNERATTKTLHVSLNFDPSEKLSNDKLIEIASVYMNRIGFGEQPFLIYKHYDAGHPHVHVITTTIREDGSRINTHNIGRNQSEKARKEIETKYSLIRAEQQKQILKQNIRPVNTEKIIYGKTETKKSITNVVSAILNSYKYTSLPEFNAILKQYSVVADRGSEEGRIFKNRGLVYRVLDQNGNKIGVPIKASSMNSQPTLTRLEKIFALNESKKEPFKQYLKSAIDDSISSAPSGLKELIKLLEKKNIYTVLWKNVEGRIYGITFVDNKNKTVFNGSDLGKPYSAGHLQNRILSTEQEKKEKQVHPSTKNSLPTEKNRSAWLKNENSFVLNTSFKNTPLLDDLLSPEKQQENIPFQLLKKKRRRKKRSLRL